MCNSEYGHQSFYSLQLVKVADLQYKPLKQACIAVMPLLFIYLFILPLVVMWFVSTT